MWVSNPADATAHRASGSVPDGTAFEWKTSRVCRFGAQPIELTHYGILAKTDMFWQNSNHGYKHAAHHRRSDFVAWWRRDFLQPPLKTRMNTQMPDIQTPERPMPPRPEGPPTPKQDPRPKPKPQPGMPPSLDATRSPGTGPKNGPGRASRRAGAVTRSVSACCVASGSGRGAG